MGTVSQMVGFFKQVQNKFNASYAGRYLGSILEDLGRHDSSSFGAVIKASGINLPIAIEAAIIKQNWPFQGLVKNRFADLAVLTPGGEPLVIIEIKERDGKDKSNERQIQDYIRFLKKYKKAKGKTRWFLFVTRYEPRPDDEHELAKAEKQGFRIRRIRFAKIHEALSPARPIARMVREYMEDVGVTYRDLDFDFIKPLKYLTATTTNVSAKGLGNLEGAKTVGRAAELFDTFLNNAQVLMTWLQELNKDVVKSQRPKTNFSARPNYNLKSLKSFNKHIDKVDVNKAKFGSKAYNECADRIDHCVNGGAIFFYSELELRTHKGSAWVSMELGYVSELTPQSGLHPVSKTPS
jgi:hypothetical protein